MVKSIIITTILKFRKAIIMLKKANLIISALLSVCMFFGIAASADVSTGETKTSNSETAEKEENAKTNTSRYSFADYTLSASVSDNPGLKGDITAFKNGLDYEFVIPYSCDASSFTFRVLNSDDEIEKITADFTTENPVKIEIDKRKISVSATLSTLPMMYINIDETNGTISDMNGSYNHKSYCYGDIILDVPEVLANEYGCSTFYNSAENDAKPETPGTMKIRGRGNSTWTTDTDKQRPYQIKLEAGENLLGMGKNKDWALLRSEQPKIYLRNKISYDLARDLGIKNTPRAEMTDVYMNGRYLGVYTLASTVKVGKSSVPITDIDDEIKKNGSADGIDLTGGYLLEIDNFEDSPQFVINKNKITIKSPENLDTTTEDGSKYDYIKNLICDLFNAIAGNGYLSDGRHFSEIFDLESAARYFLHQELIGNSDCCQGSTFLYKDTDSKDSIIYMGPVWDCDYAFDLYQSDWCLPNRKSYWNEHPLFVNQLCKHKEFTDYVQELYFNQGLDRIYLSYADKVAEYAEKINSSASATSRLYNIGSPTYSYISAYIKDKYNFMNGNLKFMCNSAPKGDNAVIYNINKANLPVERLFQRKNLLQFSYRNNTEEEKDVFLYVCDKANRLIAQSKPVKVAPNSVYHDRLVLPSDDPCGTVAVFDGEVMNFAGKNIAGSLQGGRDGNNYVNPDPFAEKSNNDPKADSAAEKNTNYVNRDPFSTDIITDENQQNTQLYFNRN